MYAMTTLSNKRAGCANEFRNNSGADLVNAVAGKKVLEREVIEADLESLGSSSEDMESPRSVVMAKGRKWPAAVNKDVNVYVHSQILRLREEDSHIGEDIADNMSASMAMEDDNRYQHHVDVWILASHRPILPASPLSGKVVTKSLH